ncbi:phosphoribosylamine--glycine ligase [Ponticaulis sp.]|uniref:phosphoribosylamine--glycine ligase n=1 Tax=Ponticaulis sp. TaxID=2020902 RepID=UPI000B6BA504|nr:phosphoribosylamine--glycine ligase [Ponticaulis sp.]MAI88890.1 phosphoribosylamine--glycine ligase [Ponticaulis sp.]OUY01581.1 MAG: phosphoribosylamine--glycine ligase [Hyphomonadaceae bacterium TMED5]|tara:strand:+ start:12065 stop:13348 length:1284 start_codon:yes stop_codon:yes gene_type:complete
MNILVIGSGGREHALAWKINQSALVDEVWSAPGNPGMHDVGPCFDVKADDIDGLEKLARQLDPDLVIVGPEQPLADGLADRLRSAGYDVFGPSAAAAQIEASKGFSKDLMAKYNIPTARYQRVTTVEAGKAFLDTLEAPFVLKADGLAAGKGVVIAETREVADKAVEDMLAGQFGAASAELVIEEFMQGEEASVFAITDGENFICLPAAQDHKRAYDGDEGPNTGGMGAYAPAPVISDALMSQVKETIVTPSLKGLEAEGAKFQGVLYVGLMISSEGPKVVEYNCRFGDPECQVLMMGLEGDIVPLLLASSTGGYSERDFEKLAPEGGFQPSVTVVMASEGYPGSYEKGTVIEGVKTADRLEGVKVFHAGTDVRDDGELVAVGGRVLNVTATGPTLEQAFQRAYSGINAIDWPKGFYRSDIGWRVRD